jgi:hypothetical protein
MITEFGLQILENKSGSGNQSAEDKSDLKSEICNCFSLTRAPLSSFRNPQSYDMLRDAS